MLAVRGLEAVSILIVKYVSNTYLSKVPLQKALTT